MEGVILVIDDQPEVTGLVGRTLSGRGYRVESRGDAESARSWFAANGAGVSLVILDLDLGGGQEEGLALLGFIKRTSPDCPVVMLSGKGSPAVAARAVRAGAADFLEKGLYLTEKLEMSVRRIEDFVRAVEENRRLVTRERGLDAKAELYDLDQADRYTFVGSSPAARALASEAERIARIPRPVLITGERGTGKELVAALVHRASPRAGGPFVVVNAAAVAVSLFESEFFGHEKGAFTGADERRRGRLELADGGTLFLDEVSNMDPAVQEKLLRVIEYTEFQRVGGSETVRADVRFIAATNADLEAAMVAGGFRRDLYDRLAFEVIRVPPLAERLDDVGPLAGHFAGLFAREVPAVGLKTFGPDAVAALKARPWPGNVRELKAAVERIAARSPGRRVSAADVEAVLGAPAAGHSPPGTNFDEVVRAVQRDLLTKALEAEGGNQKRAAARLGLTYDRVRYYRSKLR